MDGDEVIPTSLTEEELTLRVVETVATHEGVDPKAIVEPIGEVLDPDALETLFRPKRAEKTQNDVRVIFQYYEYEVTVTATHDIYLTEKSEP
ncbi:HalOD1 output domain-containing protein [Halorussus salinisoli]|uniref:HalOD1 output domain-containing protein n=1 Tax=Halorussus salinisoli TaxID=2558242 RepID=UPI0010C243EA|nr:HalOD1 output domain-containing protein [Halorussus salinisoli]